MHAPARLAPGFAPAIVALLALACFVVAKLRGRREHGPITSPVPALAGRTEPARSPAPMEPPTPSGSGRESLASSGPGREPVPKASSATAPQFAPEAADLPVLFLRARSTEGPLADSELEVRILTSVAGREVASSHAARTDASGVARLVAPRAVPQEAVLQVTRRTPAPELHGTLELSLRPGEQWSGEVLLHATALFASGRVLLGDGAPAEGVALVLERRAEGGAWTCDPGPRELTGSGGAFELRGERPFGEYRLVARRRDALGRSATFAPGEADLRIELVPEALLAGRLLVDPEVPLASLRVRVEGEEGEHAHLDPSERERVPVSNGSFRFERLLTGLHAVRVTAAGDERSLAEVEAVFAAQGEETRDPRLDPLDLRGLVFRHRIVLITVDEGRLEGRMTVAAYGSELPGVERALDSREFELLLPWDRIDVGVEADGHAPASRAGVSGTLEIELVPGPLVRLELGGHVRLPEAPYFIGAALVPADGRGPRSVALGNATFDASRQLLLRAPRTGVMQVQWYVEHRDSELSHRTEVRLLPQQLVDVQDVSLTQRRWVTLDEEQMARLLAALRRSPGR